MWERPERGGLLCRTTFSIINGITAIYWLNEIFFYMAAIVYACMDVDYSTVLINSCHCHLLITFKVTDNKTPEERVYIWRQPAWPKIKQTIPNKLTRVWKSKRLSIGASKWQKTHWCQLWAPSNVLKIHWFFAKHHTLRLSIREWEMITHNPAVRDRENHWLSCDHVKFSITYYSYCKTLLICEVKI